MYPDLAAIVTAAVMGMMFYFGPWADPPGMDELWWLLTTAAVILASWRWWGKPTSYLITRAPSSRQYRMFRCGMSQG